MPPNETIWPREPHTEGKHLVLRNYLDAWLPILGSWNGRILFVDGFAGPGEYEGGEDGSPIIAMKALIDHAHKNVIRSNVVFFFVEARTDRARHLATLVDALRPQLPANAAAHVIESRFDEQMNEVLDHLDEQSKQIAPALVMIDPFGVSHTPMTVIRRIMKNPRCEVYVSFMYEHMNRFITTPEFQDHLDDLFGSVRWREALELVGEDRKAFLYNLYAASLREAGAAHVVHFDLYEGNRLVYAIFFGTQHAKGCDVMKRAIWKVVPFGDYCFRGSRDHQLRLGVDQPNFTMLENALADQFRGQGFVDIAKVTRFVQSDRVEYHTGHLKKNALKAMERDGRILVDEDTRNRAGTYPPGTKICFDV